MTRSTTRLSHLPNEIYIQILKNLDRQRDIHSLSCVSRQLYNLSYHQSYIDNIKNHNCSALFWAAYYGQEATARNMLQLEADVNIRQGLVRLPWARIRSGGTPLHVAAHRGHVGMIELLLDNGADPGVVDHTRCIPLTYALYMEDEQAVRTITRHDKDAQDRLMHALTKETALHLSCMLLHLPLVHFFITQGADVNALDAYGKSPLHRILVRGQFPRRMTPIVRGNFTEERIYCSDEVLEIVKLLLSYGADPNLTSTTQAGLRPRTPLVEGLLHEGDRVRTFFLSLYQHTPMPAAS